MKSIQVINSILQRKVTLKGKRTGCFWEGFVTECLTIYVSFYKVFKRHMNVAIYPVCVWEVICNNLKK
jgi:hypothetical protein